MGFRGYYLTDSSMVVSFPKAEVYGSNPVRREEGDLVHEAEGGNRWVYKQFTRRTWELTFIVTEADGSLQFFLGFHETLGGQETPFYFIEDVDGDLDSNGIHVAYYVRKEQHFELNNERVGVVNGVEYAFYDYTMRLSEEPEAEGIAL